MATSSVESRPYPLGGDGLPFVGETLEFLGDPVRLAERRAARYGESFTARNLGMRLVVLPALAANRWIFSSEGKVLENRRIFATRALLGANRESMLGGEARRARRRILAPHFLRNCMGPQVEPVVECTHEHLRGWAAAGGETSAVERFKRLAFEIAARYIFGEAGPVDLPRLSEDFDRVDRGGCRDR